MEKRSCQKGYCKKKHFDTNKITIIEESSKKTFAITIRNMCRETMKLKDD